MARGRPAASETAEDRRDDRAALLAEMRDMADEVIPLSAYLWKRAAIDGDVEGKRAASGVVYFARRLAQRADPPKDAA